VHGIRHAERNPDLKWRQPESALAELVAKQRSILAAAATLVKPGGRIVYATCSVLPEENDAVVADFIAAHPAFERVDAAAEWPALASSSTPARRLCSFRTGMAATASTPMC
jgi:16S rRNA (cytosine967-C5)-methyltransferase